MPAPRPSLRQLTPALAALVLLAGWASPPVEARQEVLSPPAASPSVQELEAESGFPVLIRDVQIPARDAGVLTRLLVREGDIIEVDAIVAELDRDLFELEHRAALKKLELAQLKASDDVDLRYSEKSLQVADATLARSTSALDQYAKSISMTEIERLRLEAERASLSIERAEFDRRVAEAEAELNTEEEQAAALRLMRRSVRSPIAGIVVERLVQEGEWLSAGQGILRVIQLDRLRITAVIRAEKINRSFVGRIAEFRPNGGDRAYTGPIQFVSPEVTPNGQLVQFFFEVDNADLTLRPGEKGRVVIPPSP